MDIFKAKTNDQQVTTGFDSSADFSFQFSGDDNDSPGRTVTFAPRIRAKRTLQDSPKEAANTIGRNEVGQSLDG